ncbi:hypothetical protein F2P81_023047 [Scophthalmus maximus]|uniref:Uncharacterized protein n=1 Tax=Scophthalmus maximus TaxID=52904 RepID=A0A6A4RVK0_SCOMX|nr:hypothetical protein F2P81_023047 [Scophthalmus maximus]
MSFRRSSSILLSRTGTDSSSCCCNVTKSPQTSNCPPGNPRYGNDVDKRLAGLELLLLFVFFFLFGSRKDLGRAGQTEKSETRRCRYATLIRSSRRIDALTGGSRSRPGLQRYGNHSCRENRVFLRYNSTSHHFSDKTQIEYISESLFMWKGHNEVFVLDSHSGRAAKERAEGRERNGEGRNNTGDVGNVERRSDSTGRRRMKRTWTVEGLNPDRRCHVSPSRYDIAGYYSSIQIKKSDRCDSTANRSMTNVDI